MGVAPWMESALDSWFGATWPGWLCWWFGHEPTEHVHAPDLYRCRCGAFQVTYEMLPQIGRPNWWTKLVKALPARRPIPWRGYVLSAYRTPADQQCLEEQLATSNHRERWDGA